MKLDQSLDINDLPSVNTLRSGDIDRILEAVLHFTGQHFLEGILQGARNPQFFFCFLSENSSFDVMLFNDIHSEANHVRHLEKLEKNSRG